MSLKQQLTDDLRAAMKKGDATFISTLRLVATAVHNKEIEKRLKDLDDEGVLAVLSTEAKKRKDAIAGYEKGGRKKLAEKEAAEFVILQRYLPAQLSEDDIRTAVEVAIAKVGATSPKDMGKVMGTIMKKLKGQADGNTVRRIVGEALAKSSI